MGAIVALLQKQACFLTYVCKGKIRAMLYTLHCQLKRLSWLRVVGPVGAAAVVVENEHY